MSVSLDYLQRCGAQTGFQPATLEKVVRLGELAGDIARHPLLGKTLALKGGTPLNLAFGPPRRLSVDLDYNYVAKVDRDAMLADRPHVENALTVLAERQGYRVQPSADAFAGRTLHLHFSSAFGMGGVIQIDINYLHRLPLDDVEDRTLWQPGELDRPRVVVVSVQELLVGKLLALLDRGSPRDAWDVASLPGAVAEVASTPRLRQLFVALAATLDQPLATYTRQRLDAQLTERLVTAQLTPMLAVEGPPDARALADQAWELVAGLVTLSQGERDYFAAVEQGELRLELLFPDQPAEAARLAGSPALQWKLANVRRKLQGTESEFGMEAP
jgi:predicted nucleotidyltransferase component of viral defense system